MFCIFLFGTDEKLSNARSKVQREDSEDCPPSATQLQKIIRIQKRIIKNACSQEGRLFHSFAWLDGAW